MESALLIFPCIAILCAPALLMVMGTSRRLNVSHSNPGDCRISIIIPARDEEHNISNLLESIHKQNLPPLETIVVNDGSSDNTAGIARSLGAMVIDSEPLPEDWNGKPWACHQGAKAAKGDMFLFLDADTILAKNALETFQGMCTDAEAVHSVCPYHRIKRPYEELSAFFNVMMLAGSGSFGLAREQHPALFGQCMLISREHYQQSGGHSAVKDEILENFHLSTELHKLGIPCKSHMGGQIVRMRMFPGGLGELWASWQKGFSSGAAHAPKKALLWSSIWISGLMFSLVSLALLTSPYTTPLYSWLTVSAYFLGVIQCLRAFRLAGSFSFFNALLFPISLVFYQVLFFSSAANKKRGRHTHWKGRKVN